MTDLDVKSTGMKDEEDRVRVEVALQPGVLLPVTASDRIPLTEALKESDRKRSQN